jgi:hypothetical protein
MYDKYSGRSRRLVFVMMKIVEDANVVIKKLNGIVSVTSSLSCYKCAMRHFVIINVIYFYK